MLGVFKKTVNSTIGTNNFKSLNDLIGQILNSSYNTKYHIPLNKILSGNICKIADVGSGISLLNDSIYVEVIGSSSSGKTNTKKLRILNTEFSYNGLRKLYIEFAPSIEYVGSNTVFGYSVVLTRDKIDKTILSENNIYLTYQTNKTSYSSLPIYLQNNDILTITWTVTGGTDQTSPHLQNVSLTNLKEKQVPYITIIDKESDN